MIGGCKFHCPIEEGVVHPVHTPYGVVKPAAGCVKHQTVAAVSHGFQFKGDITPQPHAYGASAAIHGAEYPAVVVFRNCNLSHRET